ncbi:MAG: hypothetical protein HW412_196 [Bacteroidetes bacterium]|nr:hypothetical protein [Bacteroidota bacterium]
MLPDRDFAGHLESLLRFRIARSVLYLHLLWTSATYAQRTSTSFGPTIDLSLGYTPIGLVRSTSQSEVVVLAHESPTMFCYTVAPNGAFIQSDLINLSNPSKEITVEYNQREEVVRFGLLSTDGEVVSIIHKAKGGFEEKTVPVSTPSQKVAFGDINSDKRMDLLLFGKKRTGVTPMLKQKNGNYADGPVRLPDLSISDLRCIDLNGDNISDLLVLNWVSNQLALFYGIGHGVFSEQVGVTLEGEPTSIAISPVTKDRTLRIAVAIPEEKLVSMFRCNAAGEIEPTGSLRFASAPVQIKFAAINKDKELDLVVTAEQSVYVFLGESNSRLGPPTPFGAGKQIVSCEVMDLDGDHKNDLVLIDRASKRIAGYANSDRSGTIDWPATYGVGDSPKAIAALDVNDDGLLDVVVANSGSSSLSVLLNRGEGRFAGQQIISVSDQPFSVKSAGRSSKGTRTILTSLTSADRVSIVRIGDDISTSGVFTLPTGPNPYIVRANQDSVSGHLEFLTRYTNPRDASLSLSFFRQITGGQLIERNIRASLTGQITALTIDDFFGTGKYELVFVTHDKGKRQSALSLAFSTEEFDFKTVKSVMSFADSTASVHALLSGYIDDDRYKDLLLIMSRPRTAMGIVYGKEGGMFKDSLYVLRNVEPLNEDAVLLRDVDNDGHTDLTWIDSGKNAVMTIYGRGNRKFDSAVTVAPARGVTAIEIASIKFPDVQDLILANGSKGSVSIMFDPFR